MRRVRRETKRAGSHPSCERIASPSCIRTTKLGIATLKRIGKEMSEEKGCKNRDIVREIP